MPEEVQDVSAEGAQEPQGLPVPDISAGSQPESSAQPGLDVSAVAEAVRSELKADLDNLVDARFKSAKDVRFSKVDEIYNWVKEAGGDPAKIQNQVEVAELRNRLAQLEGDRGGSPTQAPQQKSLADKTAEFLAKSKSELGVELNRDEISALRDARSYTSEDQWYQELTKAIVKKAKSGATQPAAVVQPSGSVATGKRDADEVAAEIESLMSSGKLHKVETQKRLDELRAELDEVEPVKIVKQGISLE